MANTVSDFNYTNGTDGFTAIYPNTPQAVDMFAKVIEVTGGFRLLPNEFKAFASQARKAGYSVRKEVVAAISDDELMAELA